MKTDVIVSVYGKPNQTLCTLKSLYKHSGQWIDKLYFLEEAQHPFDDEVSWIMDYFENVVHYKPKRHYNPYAMKSKYVPHSNIRHQYGIESSDKQWVFICHNDVLFLDDIIGNMLLEIEKWDKSQGHLIGVGEIGQCWNCPAKAKGFCSGETFYEWWPTYQEVLDLGLPHIRTRVDNVHKENPKPLPECRLNEWACLIDREVCIKEGSPYFGDFDDDSGTAWFRSMHLKGYKFKDYRKDFHHAYWANMGGFQVQQKEDIYKESEQKAAEYYEKNF